MPLLPYRFAVGEDCSGEGDAVAGLVLVLPWPFPPPTGIMHITGQASSFSCGMHAWMCLSVLVVGLSMRREDLVLGYGRGDPSRESSAEQSIAEQSRAVQTRPEQTSSQTSSKTSSGAPPPPFFPWVVFYCSFSFPFPLTLAPLTLFVFCRLLPIPMLAGPSGCY